MLGGRLDATATTATGGAVRAQSRDNQLTLVFGSQHANPFPVVSADVAFPSADPLPTTVQATLTINGTSTSQSP